VIASMVGDLQTPDVVAAIRQRCRGDLIEGPEGLAAFARDFGGMIERTPAVVLRPASDDDVVAALRLASEHQLSITTRGAGHCQAGQGLGAGIVMDMTSLDRVLAVRADEAIVEAQAGASWNAVVEATYGAGHLPCGLTHALDPTIGGTLSIGGVGPESYRCGPQVDNVVSLDVATSDGDIVRCSLDDNRRLFDAVRAGVGQCGVILRVRYPIRPCKRTITTRRLVYGDARRFMQDATALATEGANGVWLAGTVTRHPVQRDRRILVLLVGQEGEPDDGVHCMPGVRADVHLPAQRSETWTPDGCPTHGFFRLFGGAPGDRRYAAPVLNPWVEHIFSIEGATGVLESLLAHEGAALAHGQAGVILIRRTGSPAPLLAVPPGELLAGVGVFATFGVGERARAEVAMAEHCERVRPFGGKRYLSGYFARTSAAQWALHFGDDWPAFRAAKESYDSRNLLNPGFIQWPREQHEAQLHRGRSP
jgi:cytokinin dehydrogenase